MPSPTLRSYRFRASGRPRELSRGLAGLGGEQAAQTGTVVGTFVHFAAAMGVILLIDDVAEVIVAGPRVRTFLNPAATCFCVS